MSKKNNKVKIVEVGLRDGLQNEKTELSADDRFDLYEMLVASGIQNIEVGAFVSPKWVPQMAVTAQLASMIYSAKEKLKKSKTQEAILVPNELGMLRAIEAGAQEVAIFAACSENFSLKNINCSIAESFERFGPVMKLAREHNIKVRGYLSTCFGCPFEGPVPEARVVQLAKRMRQIGVYEVSIGDTIGIANPRQVTSLFKKLKTVVPASQLAGHFHDTRGTALANILAAFECGIRIFDTSIGGLGGCPYAPGATGNVATEDVVYMFEGMKVRTGVNFEGLVQINKWLQPKMNHPLSSKAGQAGRLKPLGKVKK